MPKTQFRLRGHHMLAYHKQFELLYGAMGSTSLVTVKEEISHGYELHFYEANEHFDPSLFNGEELKVMQDSLKRMLHSFRMCHTKKKLGRIMKMRN